LRRRGWLRRGPLLRRSIHLDPVPGTDPEHPQVPRHTKERILLLTKSRLLFATILTTIGLPVFYTILYRIKPARAT
jgi:hypothetical protein